MRVDGPTPSGALPIRRPQRTGTQTPPQRIYPSDAERLTARETRLSSGVSVQDATRAITALRDTFQRASPQSRTAQAASGGEDFERPKVISQAFEAVHSAAAEPPRAEIPDLETTTQARGLPLISEPYHDGPAFDALLEAYRDPGHGAADLDSTVEPGDGFDTQG